MTDNSLTQDLLAQLQGAPMQQMAEQLGASNAQIQSAVGAALPLLLGALGRNAAQPEGATALLGALQRDHLPASAPQGLAGLGGGLGELLGAALGGALGNAGGAGGAGGGAAILGHILGGQQSQAQQQLGQASGLGGAGAGQLLAMLAPLVMSFLAQRAQGGGLDAGGLGQMLGRERAQQQGGPAGDLPTSLLDQNGDGKLDAGDLLKFGAGLLSGRR